MNTTEEPFHKKLNEVFPGAQLIDTVLAESASILKEHGFHKDSTIALVSVCRDEITRPFVRTIDELWGDSFDISSLGGMILCGKTGFLAGMSHSPLINDQERYVFYVCPHIAIDEDGIIGNVSRRGRPKSHACGALLAFKGEIEKSKITVQLEGDNLEQSILKQRLTSYLKWGDVPTLSTLTYALSNCINDTLEKLIASTINSSHCSYAIVGGIQIHGPKNLNYFMPRLAYAVDQGKRVDLLDQLRGIDADHRIAVHLAASQGHLNALKLLAEKKPLDVVDSSGQTPIESSMVNEQFECAAFLHSSGQKLTNEFIKERLIIAAFRGDIKIIRTLIEFAQEPQNAINCCDSDLRTPLHLAAGEGHLDVVQFLCENGATFKTDRSGQTPLQNAQAHGKTAVANYLQSKH